MEMYDIVRPGDRVDIESVASSELPQDERKYYISKVYDMNEDEDLVEILMPMEKTRMIVLSVGERYDLFFYAGKGIYACTAEVVSRRNDGGIAVASLTPVTKLMRHQRREYFRYDCVIGMSSRVLGQDETRLYEIHGEMDPLKEPQDKGVIVDISGGGLRFVSPTVYEEGSLVHCRFILQVKGKLNTYNAVARILSVENVANNAVNKEYRGQFLKMLEGEREEIISYIFEEERKMRAKQSGK
ncbi:MAG: flagellar brake domain-containing protein [Lachnospiraceae bacterium]|nr:flagellar brake domain-containing protein [Lachnospiraceae bacterium]